MEKVKTDFTAYGIDPGKGRSYEGITYVLALIYNLLQGQVERYLLQYGLSAVQFNLLMLAAYKNEDNRLNQVELSKHLIASASNITKLVEKSVRCGLITRKINPQSRRENIICITKKGQALIDKVWPGYDKLVRGLTEKIPAKDRPQIERILKNWFMVLKEDK